MTGTFLSWGLSEFGLDYDWQAFWRKVLEVPERPWRDPRYVRAGGTRNPRAGGLAGGRVVAARSRERRERAARRSAPLVIGRARPSGGSPWRNPADNPYGQPFRDRIREPVL